MKIETLMLVDLQGGSDISGTLSKLHRCINISYFLVILSHQTVSASCRTINKKKQKLPAKMNQQGATRAGIVSGPCAGCTENETMETSMRTQFTVIQGSLHKFIASGGSADRGSL